MAVFYLMKFQFINPPFLLHLVLYKSIIYIIFLLIILFFFLINIPVVDEVWSWFGKTFNPKHTTTANTETNSNTNSSTTITPPVVVDSNGNVQIPEVFNVSNNLYSYADAPHICAALGASLASYEQVESSYNQGAEWCNYGWTDGGMALYPTQTTTWKELQSNPLKKDSCGRPGINGGVLNPNLRFGVNCFGIKPAQKANDPFGKVQPSAPANAQDAAMQKKVDFWKENANTMLNIHGYNMNQWSEFR
jgi:hypothetical protein